MFRELQADAWSIQNVDAVCITTNGFVSKKGLAAVGFGVAKSASERYPELPAIMAKKLLQNGHVTQIIMTHLKEPHLVSFPVKPGFVVSNGHNVVSFKRSEYPAGTWVPGFHAKSDLQMIERSVVELVRLTDLMNWRNVVLPRPGCGAGEMSWKDVKHVLSRYLDRRFIVVWR